MKRKINSVNLILRQSLSTKQGLKKFEEIPGPRSYPFIGNLLELNNFGGDFSFNPFDKFCMKLQEKYGDLVRWSVFGTNDLFIFKSEHAKIIIQNENTSPMRPTVIPWDVYSKRKRYPPGLVNSQGEIWKLQRSASNPIVAKPQSVAMYLNTHNKIIDEFIEIMKKKQNSGDSFIIKKFETELKYLLLEMMSIVAFDKRLHCINADKRSPDILGLFNSIIDYGDLTSKLYYTVPVWMLYKNSLWKEFEKTSDFIYKKYVEESLDYVKNLKGKGNHTMLQQYLLNKNSLNFDDIVSIMSEFLLASFDTTATTFHFLLYQIATNQGIQEEIYNEVKNLGKNDFYIGQDDLAKIPLLKASLKESQRLNSIAPSIARVLSNDLVIDDYLIPKNTRVNVVFFRMSRSDKYFKNPDKFDPKRWLKQNQSIGPVDPYTSLPFGFGARMCIGRRLAEQKMYMILIKMLKNFKIEYVGEEAKTGFRLIVVPDYDLDLKLTPRY